MNTRKIVEDDWRKYLEPGLSSKPGGYNYWILEDAYNDRDGVAASILDALMLFGTDIDGELTYESGEAEYDSRSLGGTVGELCFLEDGSFRAKKTGFRPNHFYKEKGVYQDFFGTPEIFGREFSRSFQSLAEYLPNFEQGSTGRDLNFEVKGRIRAGDVADLFTEIEW